MVGSDDLLNRVLFHVLDGAEGGIQVQGRQDDQVVLSFDGQEAPRYLVRLKGIALDAQLKRLEGSLAKSPSMRVEILIIGGGQGVRDMLPALIPDGAENRIFVYHLEDGAAIWASATPKANAKHTPLYKRLSRGSIPRVLTQEQVARIDRKVAGDQAFAKALLEEAKAFHTVYTAQIPQVTYTLAVVIGIIFGFELLWGGAESTPVLARMGALMSERVLDGEWWRVLSSSFLHAGPFHLIMNTMALLALGGFMERILGSSRFIILYALSVAAGSVGHMAFTGESIAVGASAGIYGVLIAQGALAFRPRGYLPRRLIPQARKNALINLPLVVLVSFLPFVGGAAHLGGSLMGGLLVWSGVLLKGLPRFSDGVAPEAEGRVSPYVTGLASFGTLTLGASLAVSLVMGQPWKLSQPALYVRHDVPEMSISLALPQPLLKRTSVEDRALVAGAGLMDPAQLQLMAVSGPQALGPEVSTELKRAVEAMLPEESDLDAINVIPQTYGAFQGYEVKLRIPGRGLFQLALVNTPWAIYRAESFIWDGFEGDYGTLLAESVGSLRQEGARVP